jgi:hypothetical protein
VLIPDLTWMEYTALTIASVAAVLSLTNVLLGLFSVITGKDHMPMFIRRRLWKMPASAEDHRLHGTSLMLNGAATMLAMLGVTSGIVGTHGVRGFPGDAMFFITLVAFLTALTCTAGSYTLSVRARYVSTRASTDTNPGIPPA